MNRSNTIIETNIIETNKNDYSYLDKYQKMIDEYVQNELIQMKTVNDVKKLDIYDKNLSSQNNPENGSVEIN